MSLKERIYSVLVVSSAANFNSTLSGLLSEARYSPVSIVPSESAAKRELSERDFDCLIINSPLPDGNGIRFAIDTAAEKNTAVLLLVKSEIHEEVFDRVVEHGVFTLQKPTSVSMMSTAMNWMSGVRERLRKFEKKTLSIDQKMGEIRIVNRAKWVLISELKMDEPTAHRYIEKQAMDRCVSKREVAEEIINSRS